MVNSRSPPKHARSAVSQSECATMNAVWDSRTGSSLSWTRTTAASPVQNHGHEGSASRTTKSLGAVRRCPAGAALRRERTDDEWLTHLKMRLDREPIRHGNPGRCWMYLTPDEQQTDEFRRSEMDVPSRTFG